MSEARTAKEGRVNVPLGEHKTRLKRRAKKEGTSESNLARVILIDGLNRLESGELKFRGPSVDPGATPDR